MQMIRHTRHPNIGILAQLKSQSTISACLTSPSSVSFSAALTPALALSPGSSIDAGSVAGTGTGGGAAAATAAGTSSNGAGGVEGSVGAVAVASGRPSCFFSFFTTSVAPSAGKSWSNARESGGGGDMPPPRVFVRLCTRRFRILLFS